MYFKHPPKMLCFEYRNSPEIMVNSGHSHASGYILRNTTTDMHGESSLLFSLHSWYLSMDTSTYSQDSLSLHRILVFDKYLQFYAALVIIQEIFFLQFQSKTTCKHVVVEFQFIWQRRGTEAVLYCWDR